MTRQTKLEYGKWLVFENMLTIVKKRKLQWFGHSIRRNEESLAKVIMEGTVPGKKEVGWVYIKYFFKLCIHIGKSWLLRRHFTDTLHKYYLSY